MGLGGVGGRRVPVWDKSGTLHEVNRRQARTHGRGEAGRRWQRHHHHQRSRHRYLASPIPRLPSLAAEIGIAGHRKVSTRGLSLDGDHIGTSISTTGGGEAGGRDKQHPAHTSRPSDPTIRREGGLPRLLGCWVAVCGDGIHEKPLFNAGADAKTVRTRRRGHSELRTRRKSVTRRLQLVPYLDPHLQTPSQPYLRLSSTHRRRMNPSLSPPSRLPWPARCARARAR